MNEPKKVKSLNIKEDKWVIEHKTSLGNIVTFDFTYLPNDWFKKVQKEITIECITIGRPSVATLNRYNLSLIHISEPTRPCGTSRMPSSA